MIQQVNRIPIQQTAKDQAQAAQSSDSKDDFEALMKKTVSNLKSADKKKIEMAKQNDAVEKDSNQSTDTTNEPAIGTDISSLIAMLQQSVSPQVTVVDSQATGSLQLPVIQAETVPGTAIQPSAQEISSLVGTTSGNGSVVQMNSGLLGAQGSPAFAIANTAEVNTTEVLTNPLNPRLTQTQDVVDAPLVTTIPTQTLSDSPQSQILPQDEALPQTQILLQTEPLPQTQVMPQSQISVQVEQTKASPAQNLLEVQQQVMPIDQSVVSPSQSVFEAQQKAAALAKQGVDSSSQPLLDAKLGVLNTEAKSSIPVQATGYQNQNPTRFSDSLQAGNVVIKVSDASSNVVKATINQVADKISVNFKAGNPEFQMDLYPQDLGKVSIKMAMQSGVLTVEILASDPKTQSMLMANTSEIKSMLQTTISQPVQVMEQTQNKQWYQQQQDQSNQSQQQQQQQQQNQQDQNARSYLNAINGDITTDDFLTVMQHLRQQANSV